MSMTELYTFGKDGNASFIAGIQNAWRGAMAICTILEQRYLPPYEPAYAYGMKLSFTPSRLMDAEASKEVWALRTDPRLIDAERIALLTTFTKAIVMSEDFSSLVRAFREFEGETSLPDQAKIIERMDTNSIIALGWNQHSGSCDTWTNYGGYDDVKRESIPYNILTMTDHFDLFDVLKKCKEKAAEEGGVQ